MSSPHLLGVCAAIGAGIAFNLEMVIQKAAVRRVGSEAGLMRQLVRQRLWLAGFILQLLVGTPLNMLAQAYIGPAINPGLMAIGPAVLAIGAVSLAQERLGLPDLAGILLVMVRSPSSA